MTSTLQVPNAAALRAAVDSYIVQGFQVAAQDPMSATMRKPKEFNAVWAVIGFFLCLLPLLIYLIVYASEKDQVVRIVIVGGGSGMYSLSPDGNYWWAADRNEWVLLAKQLPPGAQLSPDRRFWWDGVTWVPMPASDTPPAPNPTSTQLPPPPPGY